MATANWVGGGELRNSGVAELFRAHASLGDDSFYEHYSVFYL